MTVSQLPLPTRWIEAIHARLTLAYGPRFAEQFAGVDQGEVLQAWARELRYCSKDQIAYALDHLPGDFPPNMMQFKAICKEMPRAGDLPALGGPSGGKASPDQQARLQSILARFKAPADPKQWARDLRDRDATGERLSVFQRGAWRRALSTEMLKPSNGAGCSDV